MTTVKMTPEQIEKEKAEKIEKAPAIQSDKADIEKPEINSTELGKSNPADATPSKESNRQYAKKVGDYKRVVQMAKEKGVDLDNIGEMPLMDSDKNKITEAVKSSYGRELATGIQGISDAITAPKNEERSKIDVKALMDLEKKKRRSRFSDAMYAFGEGLQGKTANPEAFTSTKIQRKQDEQFQAFKDVTERNQKAKFVFEHQSRKELIDWADQESRNMEQNQEYREKMKMIAEKNTQDQANKERGYKIQEDRNKQDQKNKERGFKIQEDRNNIARNKKPGGTAKEEKTVKIQTAKKTYELKPEEAELYKGEVLNKPEKYPKLFNKIQKLDQWNIPIDGEYTYEMKAKYNDVDFIRAYLEVNKDGFPQFEESKANLLKIYKDRGELEEKPTQSQSQPKQTVKADPLGLFSVKATPRPQVQPKQETQKSQYSTGGLY